MKYHTSDIVIKPSKFGEGLFVNKNFDKGIVLLKITGRVLNFNETVLLGDKECYCLQIGNEEYIVPDHPFYLSNHSCDPNCGINKNMELITLRRVRKGEELYWDYSTSMLERYWTMQCHCESPKCRKIITDFDLIAQELQVKYRQLGIVLPFIEEYLSVISVNDTAKSLII